MLTAQLLTDYAIEHHPTFRWTAYSRYDLQYDTMLHAIRVHNKGCLWECMYRSDKGYPAGNLVPRAIAALRRVITEA